MHNQTATIVRYLTNITVVDGLQVTTRHKGATSLWLGVSMSDHW